MVNLPFLMNVSYLLRDGFVVVAVEQNRGKKKRLALILVVVVVTPTCFLFSREERKKF
jgi:hypothetical protein